jgi:hypothetical protein
MFVFLRQLVVGDVSVIHPAAASFAGSAACSTPSLASPYAAATRLWASLACMPLLGCPAGPRCAASVVPWPRWSEVVRGCLLDGRLG